MLFPGGWGFMATGELYCPEGNHGIKLIKGNRINTDEVLTKQRLFFWQRSLPFETNTDFFWMIPYAFEKQPFFFSQPGRVSLKGDKTLGAAEAPDSELPLPFQIFFT